MENKQILEILDIYNEAYENTKKALKEVGVSLSYIELATSHFPSFNKLLPEESIEVFKEFRKSLILYLDSLGFSQREIARRIGGSSQNAVFQVLKERSK